MRGGRTSLAHRLGWGGGSSAVALPTTNLAAGWEARDATTDANGDIESVPDLSGNGNTITSVGGLTERATLAADADYGGQLVGVFTGNTTERINRTTFTQGALSQPTTVYWIGEKNSASGVGYCYDGRTTRQALLWGGIGEWQALALTTLQSGVTTFSPRAICTVYNSTSSEIYADSNFVTASATGDAGANGLNGFAVAASHIGASPLAGRWAAIYVYEGAHNASQRAAVAAYVNQEFGLSITT